MAALGVIGVRLLGRQSNMTQRWWDDLHRRDLNRTGKMEATGLDGIDGVGQEGRQLNDGGFPRATSGTHLLQAGCHGVTPDR